MGTLTLQIHSPTHSPHPFSFTVDTHSTVTHLKQLVRQHLALSTAAADLGLVLDGHILNDADTLDKVFEKVDCTSSLPHIHLIVSSPSGQVRCCSPIYVNDEPCSPAPLQFHHQFSSFFPSSHDTYKSTTPPLQLPTNTIPEEERTPTPGTTERCRGNNSMADASPTTSVPEEKMSTIAVPPTYLSLYPQALAPLQYQYVLVNGMPYLAPSYYLPLLHVQQHAVGGYAATTLPSGTGFNSPVIGLQQQNQPQPQREAGEGVVPEGNAQDHAARGQRRAASLWLLLKLAFGVYLFSQNGSIERIVLLHIAALIIFLHQTGRLRIVRRVPRPPQDAPRDPAVNVAGTAAAAAVAAEQPSANPYQATTPQAGSTPTALSESQNTTNAASSSVSSKQVDKHDSGLQMPHNHGRSGKLDPTFAPTPGQDARAIPSAVAAETSSRSSASGNTGTQNANTTAEQAPPATYTQRQRGSTWRHVEHGILTFIASLIPTPPPENEQLEPNAVPVAERAL
ncbi:MAG: hypothetical protein J3R72DRAFT_421365 [Linnemannia gamsii]|nr:MAG: hypothetical protein J3R72DRAFT_421365 [Linnemannia gamsii]